MQNIKYTIKNFFSDAIKYKEIGDFNSFDEYYDYEKAQDEWYEKVNSWIRKNGFVVSTSVSLLSLAVSLCALIFS